MIHFMSSTLCNSSSRDLSVATLSNLSSSRQYVWLSFVIPVNHETQGSNGQQASSSLVATWTDYLLDVTRMKKQGEKKKIICPFSGGYFCDAGFVEGEGGAFLDFPSSIASILVFLAFLILFYFSLLIYSFINFAFANLFFCFICAFLFTEMQFVFLNSTCSI